MVAAAVDWEKRTRVAAALNRESMSAAAVMAAAVDQEIALAA